MHGQFIQGVLAQIPSLYKVSEKMSCVQAISLLEVSILQEWWVLTSCAVKDHGMSIDIDFKGVSAGFISVFVMLRNLENI